MVPDVTAVLAVGRTTAMDAHLFEGSARQTDEVRGLVRRQKRTPFLRLCRSLFSVVHVARLPQRATANVAE